MTSEADWPVVRLEDIADDITVGHVGPMVTEYVPVGVPFLRSQNVEPFRISLADVKYVGEEFHGRLSKSALHPGDVVIVRTGRPGSAAVVPPDLPVANCADLVIVRPGSKLDARYLMYFINSAGTGHVASHLVGAVQQHFNVGSARTLRIPLPPLLEQQRIAWSLGALDDKIELNGRTNRTLESITRAIFKSWFLDFEPVRRKTQGGEGGLPSDLDGLFPRSFESSPLGPIPSGWRVSEIGQEVSIVGGSTPSTSVPEYWNGDVHFATPRDLADLSSPVLLETERLVTQAGAATISSGILSPGAVLMSSRAPIGYLAINEVPVCVNQGFVAMKCDRSLPNSFVLQWARSNMDAIVGNANGTTFLEISKRNFRPLPVVVPPEPLLQRFHDVAKSLHERVVVSCRESVALAEMRDALLPRLISGEVSVPCGSMSATVGGGA